MSIKQSIDTLRVSIEAQFSRWGEVCYKHPWKIILAVFALVIYICIDSFYLNKVVIDTSTAGFLHKNDPVRVTYDQFQREFSRDEKALLLLQGDVFSEDFLQRLKALHLALEDIPQVADVDSLLNARNSYGEDDEIIVEDLLEVMPETAEQMAKVKQAVANNQSYQKRLINDDMTITTIIVTMDNYSANELTEEGDKAFITGEEVGAVVTAIDALIVQHETEGFQISAAGSPHLMHLLTVILGQDMVKFSLLGVVIIAIFLALLFRRVVMVFLPILVSMLATIFTIALMAFFDIALTTAIQILPSFLLAVGVGNSVHLFTAFFQEFARSQDKQKALVYALGHSGLAIVMTGLTTAGGLLSFVSAEIKPVSDFGFVTPMGILCALFFSLVLLPALIAVVPIKVKPLKDSSNSPSQRFLMACASFATTKPKTVLAMWAALLLPSFYLISGIQISHFPINWFPEGNELRTATKVVSQELGGSSYMEILIDTETPDGVKAPELQLAMQEATDFAKGLVVGGMKIGHATSIIDITKELNQSLHGNDKSYYSIPEDRALLAQEFLLYELSGNEDMQQIINQDFSKTRMTYQLPFADAVKFPPFLDELEEGVLEIIGDKAKVTFTGVFVMMGRTVDAMLKSMVSSYLIAFLIITPLMIFLVGSLRLGLMSMIPNLVPIIMTMGLMQLLSIPLDAFTLLIGSIGLGLAVDDTIHFLHNYQRFYVQSGNSQDAVFRTMKTTGQALLFTSLVLSLGFFVNMFATMINLYSFGLLTGVCIILAFLADALLAPALVTLIHGGKQNVKAA